MSMTLSRQKRSGARRRVLLACALTIGLVGSMSCAELKVYTPDPVAPVLALDGLPEDWVLVEVADHRQSVPDGDSLTLVLRRQVVSALGQGPRSSTADSYLLQVDVLDHQSQLTRFPDHPNADAFRFYWTATTRLSVRLVADNETIQGPWTIESSASNYGPWGGPTPRELGQESYSRAIDQLFAVLQDVRVPR